MHNITSPLSWIAAALDALDKQGLRRRLSTREGGQAATIRLDGRELVNFGSNDYLGLAADPRLAAAAIEAVRQEGFGSGASPLITGRSDIHRQLEERLAEFEGTEAALVFPSGIAANMGTIAALVGPGDVVFADAKNHASLWDGCRLSRADVRVYPHGDWQRLERLLERAARSAHNTVTRSVTSTGSVTPTVQARCPVTSTAGRRLIVTDSLFSMDGDLAPLGELAELAERYGAMLLVDEAHATGVFGQNGRGVAEHLGVEDRIPIRVGTLSKALGCSGGFVAGSRLLIEWLVNRARPYVFSTAAPAAIAAAALASLEIVANEPHRRRELLARAESLRHSLVERGWNVGRSASQIIPVIVGEPARAVELSAQLRQKGLFVPAIRPPTVPEGEACLRISLACRHAEEMVARLLASTGSASSPVRSRGPRPSA
jgi:8-amino-7-oxononanoate synthase